MDRNRGKNDIDPGPFVLTLPAYPAAAAAGPIAAVAFSPNCHPTSIAMRLRHLLIACLASVPLVAAETPAFFRNPTISKTHLVFEYAGDLWRVARTGGSAQRLTAGAGDETYPRFSPDGTQIAYTSGAEGSGDIFVIPAEGGVPRRLTWHPGQDLVQGWTPDGKRVLFSSGRSAAPSRYLELFTLGLDGGPEERLPLPVGYEGAYSPDGRQLAYVPMRRAFTVWKRYRGGTTTPIWIADLATSKVTPVPRDNSNDFNPMWAAGQVWFLSDREGPVTLFSYDPKSKKVTRAVENRGPDFKSAAAVDDAIVIEQFGALRLFDLKSRQLTSVSIRVAAELPETRERWVKVGTRLRNPALSPSGVRAAFEARGEIITVPEDKGDARYLTQTPGAMERYPAWSPDGRQLAFFSDASGEYALHLVAPDGRGEPRVISLGDKPSQYQSPRWSPDSRKIAYVDAHLTLWYVDVENGQTVKVGKNRYYARGSDFEPAWSPDSKWLAYVTQLENYLGAIQVYSLADGSTRQVTDGMSDARDPAWDKGGKYLYFTASTDSGSSLQPDIHSSGRTRTGSAYLIVLTTDEPSPLAPESDEEKSGEGAKAGADKPDATKDGEAKPDAPRAAARERKVPDVRIDFDQILQRVLALPLPARPYTALMAGKPGVLLALETPFASPGARGGATGVNVHRFDLKQRRSDTPFSGVESFVLADNGEKVLYRQGQGDAAKWVINTLKPMAASDAPSPAPAPSGAGGGKTLKTAELAVRIQPREEWAQMFREAWRTQRERFYDPGLHGLDLATAMARYERYLPGLSCRSDLTYLLQEMMGELSVGHLGVSSGEPPESTSPTTGLLGADYTVVEGRYRFARIFSGENWNPTAVAPLTQPGVNVRVGEFLLAVEGRDLGAADNLYQRFDGRSGKQVRLRVGPNANGTDSREVTVVPVTSETNLRTLAWVEDNRRKVAAATSGRVAYLYMPDTSTGGYTNFNRYFYSQVHMEGVIVDERFNAGGQLATDIAEILSRKPLSRVASRDGEDELQPQGAILGPKVMLINEFAGSGGDAMPWYFRRTGVGPLVGKRTWGGLVGRAGAPPLMDGSTVSAPSSAVWDPSSSKWIAENVGVEPDIEIGWDPAQVRQGRDPQLEKAIEIVLAELARQPRGVPARPAYPNYHCPGGPPTPDTANAVRR